MNEVQARKVLSITGAQVALTKDERKAINPALFALALPTLGASRTLAEYARTLTAAQRRTLKGSGAPAKKAAPKFECDCTGLKMHLSAKSACGRAYRAARA